MTRKAKSEIEFSDECKEAIDRLMTLAHRCSAYLTGDQLCPYTGRTDTPRSAAMAAGMLYFLCRADAGDLHAMLFSEKSFNQLKHNPLTGPVTRPGPLDEWLREGAYFVPQQEEFAAAGE